MAPAAPRNVEIVVISDVHLGTYGCHAEELLEYLKSIRPSKVILNGDIIDMWQFSKYYWPKTHMKVIKKLVGYMTEGIPVHYIAGNHDEMLRKFSDLAMANFTLSDKLLIEVDGKKTWIFHGDVFDVSMKYSKWLAKMGGKGYDGLILLNRAINFMLEKVAGRERISFSRKIKESVKKAVRYIDDFEQTAADIAIDNRYDTVICGHIHEPQDRLVTNERGMVRYLNSGDWVESLTALEYHSGDWHLYDHHRDFRAVTRETVPETAEEEQDTIEIPDFALQFLGISS